MNASINDDKVLHAKVTEGMIEYVDLDGKPQRLVFQCTPTSLTRSRSLSRIDSKASNPAQGTKTNRGEAGRKYTHTATPWRIDSIELWFDASLPYTTSGSARADGVSHADNVQAIADAIDHIETIAEPGPPSTEEESQTNSPPRPSPPLVTLLLGKRQWQGYVSSVTILEKEFTPDLLPRQVKVTLGLELLVTNRELEQRKKGGKK